MEFEEIKKILASIDQRLSKIEKECAKMNGHVDFVERVYQSVRKPMNLILGTPLIENKNPEESNE
jgi:hypothetical protein